MNRLLLDASVVETLPLRYTPAGVPVLEMRLEHVSSVSEAGGMRRVAFEMAAVALGDVALMLLGTPAGSPLSLDGFVAPTRKGAARLVLHIQRLAPLPAGDGSAKASADAGENRGKT
ncbi:MAG: primosomal replication protein N [Candidimonas sp.]|nr:MAG: primosomal replication protein N [Candidimonas sp.]